MMTCLLLLNLSPSRAGDTAESETTAEEAAPLIWSHGVSSRPRRPRDPLLALSLSLTGTVGSALLTYAPTAGWLDEPAFYVGLGGLMIAPSLGHLYTGEHDRAYLTSSLRLLSAGVGVGGALLADTNPASRLGTLAPPDEVGKWLMLSSGALIGGIALYDIVDSPRSARRVSPPAVSLTPTGAALTWDW